MSAKRSDKKQKVKKGGETMNFFVTMSIGAVVIFIIVIIIIMHTMTKFASNIPFPPTSSSCPDYWTSDVNGNCILPTSTNPSNPSNMGKLSVGDSYVKTSATAPTYYYVNPNDPAWIVNSSVSQVCAQREWALQNGLEWNGVTNFTGC